MIARIGWLVVMMGCSDAADSTRHETGELTQEVALHDEVVVPDAAQADSSSDVDSNEGEAVDAADVPGAVTGSTCDDDDECRSGWCVASAVGRVCVDLCVTECDAGEACIAVDSGTDPVSVCVPTVAPDVEVVDARDALETDDAGDALDDVATNDGVTPDETALGDATPTETDTAMGGDHDGDGIPDDEDHLPCLAITLVVFNEDVSSASLVLNGVEAVSANAFPTDDAIYVTINPTQGENTLALGGQLTGSPSDTLTLFITDGSGVVYFATVITREPGKPNDRTYTFTIDVTCP